MFVSAGEERVLAALNTVTWKTGLEIVRENPRLSHFTVYIHLGRLEEKGLVEQQRRKTKSPNGQPRIEFRLTSKGGNRKALIGTGTEEMLEGGLFQPT